MYSSNFENMVMNSFSYLHFLYNYVIEWLARIIVLWWKGMLQVSLHRDVQQHGATRAALIILSRGGRRGGGLKTIRRITFRVMSHQFQSHFQVSQVPRRCKYSPPFATLALCCPLIQNIWPMVRSDSTKSRWFLRYGLHV